MGALDIGLPDVGYSGFTDTIDGYTGSTTLQDTTIGSDLPLDFSGGGNQYQSITDFADQNISDYSTIAGAQALSGVTDPPIGSAAYSVKNTNPPQPSGSLFDTLSGLGKFGASLATAFTGRTSATQQYRPTAVRPTTSSAIPLAASGSSTLILVIVIGTLIFFLARSKEV